MPGGKVGVPIAMVRGMGYWAKNGLARQADRNVFFKGANYRYGLLVFATQGGARFGMGPEGEDEFERGGVLEFPGSPVCISATNVN